MTTAPTDRRAIITEALRKIDDLSARLEIAEKAIIEPIAVVGMGCRFPGGVNNPDQYWDLLRAGRSGIVRVPANRWDADAFYADDNSVPGTICTRDGGFITTWQPDEFDAEFFSISPREAAAMDPQQRLLLEVAWEALENAGIPLDAIRGTQASVFVGITASDYAATFQGRMRPDEIDAYIPFGNALNFAAGRLSYFLGIQGPALVIDTACSSSLVSVHLACESLRLRESDTALAAGVNLILRPENSIALSRFGMLSPDGQCKTFDAGADGYVRSEGCGVVVLKRLSDALDNGDRVLALVRGTAVNQDGASSGVTVPNGRAQQALVRQALAASKLDPCDIDYVEAHGTGTSLGDPIELDALSQVFSDRGDSAPLVLGSVKTNVGHLESAGGIAGFMKTVLSVQNGYIPKHLNFKELTPFASEGAGRFTIASDGMEWPAVGRARRAGVSAFGASGTNAHVVIEQGPIVSGAVESPVALRDLAVTSLVVSGKSAARVASLAAAVADWLESPASESVGLADVAHTLNHHRSRFSRFGTVSARDRFGAVAGLRALAAGRPAEGVVVPHEGRCGPGRVFVYSGQGSQWTGMGRRLLTEEPVFAAAVDELEPVFIEQAGFSLRAVLAGGEPVVGDEQVQPVLVGLQLALTALWRGYGVEPDAVLGHSMGEVTAAVVAGALSVAEGLRVIATRSRLMSRLTGQGALALVELDAEATERLIAVYPGIELAVYASPRQSVVVGSPEQVDALIAAVTGEGRLARRVNMVVPSHHPLMDAVLPELRSALADLAPRVPVIPVFSTTLGDGSVPVFDGEYWAANLRQPVRFSQAIAAAAEQHSTFIEISAHPMLTHAIDETLAETHHHSIPTMVRGTDETLTFHTNFNATRTTHPPKTEHPPEPHPVLPGAPWHHGRHWFTPSATPIAVGVHPFLGWGITDPTNGTRIWEGRLSPDLLWLGDHRVDEACVLPGAVYAELALAAADEAFGTDGEPWTIRELSLDQVMRVTEDTAVVTTLTGDERDIRIEIRSRTNDSGWTTHATARLERGRPNPAQTLLDIGAAAAELDPEALYARLRGAGQNHGPAFRGIVGLTVTDTGAARADVRLPSEAKSGAAKLLMHPVMVDIALQTLGATRSAADLASANPDVPAVALPVRLAGVRAYGDVTEGVCAVGSLTPTDRSDRLTGQVALMSASGQVLLEIDEVEMAVLGVARGGESTRQMFALEWEPANRPPVADAGGSVLVVAESGADDPLTAKVRSLLADQVPYTEWFFAADEPAWRAAAARTDVSWDSVVLLCDPADADDWAAPMQAHLDPALRRTLFTAELVKVLSQRAARTSPRLWIVTRGSQRVDAGDQVNLAQASLRGLARVLVFEHPEFRTTTVDIDAHGTESAGSLVDELLAGAEHDEVALRSGRRYVRRLVAAPTTPSGDLVGEQRTMTVEADGPTAFRLEVDQPGRLDGLKVHALKRIPPGAGQVEVRVAMAGLNFADVLKAMGLYPVLKGQPPAIGGECVGVVSAVGDGVESVRVGQRVVAIGHGSLGSYVTTLEELVTPLPESLADRDAATFGVAYLTAWYALTEVARLEAGERVLIHSATGGVGLAAVAIAKMIGARIYTTAGSEAKRQLLSELGVEYAGDSRGLAFADEIVDVTDGEGVDVVLNSLVGEAINRGVQVLAPGGRFVELGKKDVYGNANLGLAALARSGSFSVVDLDLNMRMRPKYYRRLMEDLIAHAGAGDLAPLPVTEFDFDHVTDAFRLMASAGHIGKILVTMPVTGRVAAAAPPPPQPLVSGDAGYIIVGGMGGLGMVAARWLAQQGAGMVVLNGRSMPDRDVEAAIREMCDGGCRVEVVTGDIATAGTADRLVETVDNAGLRLGGVLHSAMVLADEIVLNMSESAAARVFAPKVTGGWRLHAATAGRDLDWWLVFSSAASLFGSPGQGAYAAANSWVDGLVDYRRQHGLPAVGINWGPWAEVGRGQFFADLGFPTITVADGLAAIQLLLAADRSRTGVFNLEVRQWFQAFPAAAGSSLFSKLHHVTSAGGRGGKAIRAQLNALDSGDRPALLASAVAEEIQAVLRSDEPINHNDALESLGLDSLMALELRNRLEARLGITLPAALVWAYPTIADLAGVLCERLGYPTDAPAAKTEPPPDEPELSDDELELLSDIVEASELEATTGAGES
jgi:phthiocerol/phenolphthiocerol synthesis type-I polyketide synthase C